MFNETSTDGRGLTRPRVMEDVFLEAPALGFWTEWDAVGGASLSFAPLKLICDENVTKT